MVEQEDEEVYVGPIDLYAENKRTCSVCFIVGAVEPQEQTTTSNSSEHENFNTTAALFELFEWRNPKRSVTFLKV